jgi:hypothetical protein
MQAAHTRELVKKARRGAGRFQRTFVIQADTRISFASLLLEQAPGLQSGWFFVENVIFLPANTERLLAEHGLVLPSLREVTFTAADASEARSLLAAALRDGLEFYFLPRPSRFLIYADHHEFVTVFMSRKGVLSQLSKRLCDAGVDELPDFVRTP